MAPPQPSDFLQNPEVSDKQLVGLTQAIAGLSPELRFKIWGDCIKGNFARTIRRYRKQPDVTYEICALAFRPRKRFLPRLKIRINPIYNHTNGAWATFEAILGHTLDDLRKWSVEFFDEPILHYIRNKFNWIGRVTIEVRCLINGPSRDDFYAAWACHLAQVHDTARYVRSLTGVREVLVSEFTDKELKKEFRKLLDDNFFRRDDDIPEPGFSVCFNPYLAARFQDPTRPASYEKLLFSPLFSLDPDQPASYLSSVTFDRDAVDEDLVDAWPKVRCWDGAICPGWKPLEDLSLPTSALVRSVRQRRAKRGGLMSTVDGGKRHAINKVIERLMGAYRSP